MPRQVPIEEEDMEVKHYLSILCRRKWVVIATFALTLIVVAVGTSLVTPIYTATTTLRIAAAVGGSQIQTNPAYYEQLLNTYAQIATSRPILQELADQLKVEQPPEIQAEVIPNTELIQITAEDPNPRLVALAANTLASILIEQSNQLYAGGATVSPEILSQQLEQASAELDQTRKDYEKLIVATPAATNKITVSMQVLDEKQRTYEALLRQMEQAQYREAIQASLATIVETAVVPVEPSQPRPTLNYALGALIGLLGGLILAFLLENLDPRLYDIPEMETILHTPILARLPKADKHHMILFRNGTSPLAESVRQLAVQLQWMDHQHPRRILLLTGAEPGQGTSTVSANLACALSEQGKKVVVVDCNVRHPQLHLLFGLPNEHGLLDVLSGGMDLKQALNQTTRKGLSVLATGPGTSLSGVDPARIQKMILDLRQQFEFVLLDAPALTVADMAPFVPSMDGLLLIIRQSHATRDAVQTADTFLSMFEGKFVGSIVNEAEIHGSHSYV
jgi:capsular exopolysaccharide synthesis family protein